MSFLSTSPYYWGTLCAMRTLIDPSMDPYALRDALTEAIDALRPTSAADAPGPQPLFLLMALRDQLRPRASEGATWSEKVGQGVYREHRVMLVAHQCSWDQRWEQVAWPDEAEDLLNIHMREAHDARSHVDRMTAEASRYRREHVTTMRSE